MESIHPPHIIDNQGNLSPSAFIPFCSFSGNPFVVGKTIPHFSVPVCNSFVPTILKDRLCYQLDLDHLKDKVDTKKLMTHGLGLLLDYNENKQAQDLVKNSGVSKSNDFMALDDRDNSKNEAMIYIGTLGMQICF